MKTTELVNGYRPHQATREREEAEGDEGHFRSGCTGASVSNADLFGVFCLPFSLTDRLQVFVPPWLIRLREADAGGPTCRP